MKTKALQIRRRDLAGAAMSGLLLAAAGSARAEAERLFHGSGVVTGVDATAGSLTIRHKPIAGLMPAMEMPFAVEPPSLIGKVKKGDAVEFDVTGGTYRIKRLKILDPAKN
jgi:Cu/Ag efflux protein CusF